MPPDIPRLPAAIDADAFDAFHDDAAAWLPIITSIAEAHGGGPIEQALDGTVLVGLAGDRVIKLYPPLLADHAAFEREALTVAYGRLSVPTPELLATGSRDGWPYVVMTRLAGESLSRVWPSLETGERARLLGAVGALVREAHGLPTEGLEPLAPPWPDFVAGQRARCLARQQRTGLPGHLCDRLESFLAGPLPEGPAVFSTGEYTPMNLLVARGRLAGMFDFGDGLLAPRQYDWLGPLCFLAAGDGSLCRAFLGGYGVALDAASRAALLRLLLLHRYSNLKAQLALRGWETARDFDDLAARLWPL